MPGAGGTGTGSGNSGNFGTAAAVCYQVTDMFNQWRCSNLGTRTISVNGTTVACAAWPLPARINGSYYFEFSAGTPDFTSFYWYTGG